MKVKKYLRTKIFCKHPSPISQGYHPEWLVVNWHTCITPRYNWYDVKVKIFKDHQNKDDNGFISNDADQKYSSFESI